MLVCRVLVRVQGQVRSGWWRVQGGVKVLSGNPWLECSVCGGVRCNARNVERNEDVRLMARQVDAADWVGAMGWLWGTAAVGMSYSVVCGEADVARMAEDARWAKALQGCLVRSLVKWVVKTGAATIMMFAK